ncbi:hypothetical protein J1605_022239 [Eschrichtius robustus]|uniref:Uncharacterized protein n=1 Tax=Eschrichtius robustus TaxID=9764 RepID=A0AB34HAD9_ESCRO|nr:hypothetical protein J1605_022239 [Eschrichtius robustus]
MQHTTLWTFVTFSAAPPHELLAALEASEIGSEIAVVRHLNFGHSCYSLILQWRIEFVMSVGKWDLWRQGGQGRLPLPASFRAVGDQVSGSPLSGDEAVKQSREVGHTPILKWMQSLLSPGKNHGYRVTMKKSTPKGSTGLPLWLPGNVWCDLIGWHVVEDGTAQDPHWERSSVSTVAQDTASVS